MRIRALIAVLLVGVELRPGKEMEVPPEAERRARLLVERGSAKLVSDKPAKSPVSEGDSDPGDEQPPESPETQPGAERADGLIGGDAAGAGSPAPAAEPNHSTTDAQTTTAGEQIAPAGGEAQGSPMPSDESGTADAGAAMSAAPAEAALTAAAPNGTKPKAKAKPKAK